MRRYFKKNADQTDLFDLVAQLKQLKQLKEVEAELAMASLLGRLELNLSDTKKNNPSNWVQVSIDSIINDDR